MILDENFYKMFVMNEKFEKILEQIQEKDSRYKEDAYLFVMEALSYTQKRFKVDRHVTGEEMLVGLRELLMNKFGPLTMAVLEFWGIKNTEDFGHVIFNLVENNILTKTEEDDIGIFRNAYNFEQVFKEGYREQLHKKISRMRS